MCFGNRKETERKTTTELIPDHLRSASQNNIGFLERMRDTGYQEYTGPRVADLSADENTAHSLIRALAGSGNAYTGEIEKLFRDYSNTPAANLGTVRAIDNVPGKGASGSTQDYMDPYLAQVLAPQLRELGLQAQKNQNQLDARATMGGAFGDARSGFEASENTKNLNQAVTDTTGRGYSAAFNNAMALKTSDINRLLDVDKTNAMLKESGLARALAGGNALMGLDKYNTGRQADLAGMLEKAGASRRGIDQARLDAQYAEYAKKTGFPLEVIKLLTGAISSTPYDKQKTEITEKPDNSGWGILGGLAGTGIKAGASALMLSDRRAKENIKKVGKLADGQPVYRYNYLDDPTPQLGLIAQEVKKRKPNAVVKINGINFVDYAAATADAEKLAA